MKRTILFSVAFFLFMPIALNAQDNDNEESPWNLSADITSRYIWRGLQLSDGLNLQPTIEYSIGNFTIGTWGSYGVGIPFAEVDVYAQYSLGNFSLLVSDYYEQDEYDLSASKYFNWKQGQTSHALEGAIIYSGPENFPISATAATFFYGCDDSDDDDKRDYSTYFELGYSFEVNDFGINPFIGGTPFKGTYCDKAGIVNVGFEVTKDISISNNFKLPISGAFIVNPSAQHVFLVFKLTLQ